MLWRNDGGNTLTFVDQRFEGNPVQPTVSFDFSPAYLDEGFWTNPNGNVFLGPSFPVPYNAANKKVLGTPATLCEDLPNCNTAYLAYNGGAAAANVSVGPYIVSPTDYDEKGVQYFEKGNVGPVKNFYTNTSIETSRLTQINSLKAQVDFIWGARTDISTMQRINSIEVKDHTDKVVYDIELNYDYFDAGCSTPSECKRLKLTSVTRNGYQVASFQYTDELSSAYNLPARFSDNKDTYGYHKASVGGKFGHVEFKNIPEEDRDDSSNPLNNNVPFYEYSANIVTLGDHNRSPTIQAQSGSLWKVNYSGGAEKTFTYNANDAGGIRIDRVSVTDGQGNTVIDRTYQYGSRYRRNAALHTPLASSVTLFSHSPYLGYDHMSVGGYQFVRVIDNKTDISTEYEFDVGNDVVESQKSRWGSSWYKIEDLPGDAGPTLPPAFSPFIGLVDRITVLDANENEISKQEFTYSYDASPDFTFTERAINRLDNNEYAVAEVVQTCRPLYLDNIVASTFEDNVEVKRKTTFSYHPTHKTLVKMVRSERVDGGQAEDFITENTTYYPSDKNDVEEVYNPAVLDDMVFGKHMVGIPIQTLNTTKFPNASNFVVTGGTATTFRKQNNLIQPYQTFATDLKDPATLASWGNSLRVRSTSSYNDDGLLESSIGDDGIETRYSYDNNAYLTSVTVDPGPAAMERTTNYSYIPLVGIDTVTSATNETTVYEYDDRNRLHLVRDYQNRIVKRYRYNNIGDSLSARIVRTGHPYTTFSQNFSYTDLSAFGGEEMTRTIWEVDNVQDEHPFFNKTYSTGGWKTVKLTLINPEYDEPATITESFYIDAYSIWNASISGDDFGCKEEPSAPSSAPTFVAVSTGDPSCSAHNYSYSWRYWLGSGSASSLGNSSSVTLPSWVMDQTGVYTIELTISDNCGRTEIRTKTFEVQDCAGGGGPGGGSCTITASKTSMSFSGTSGSASSTFNVNYTGSGSYSVGDNQSWISTSKSGNTVTVTVQLSTSNTGMVTVTGSEGCYDIVSISRDIGNPCPIGCEWNGSDCVSTSPNPPPGACGN